MDKLKTYSRFITVEPIAFLHTLSFQMNSIVSQPALYQVYCHQLFNWRNSTVDCSHLSDYPVAENQVQVTATHWSMINSLVRLLPSLVIYVILGAWGDKNGRKINILIGLASGMISSLPLMFIIQYPDTPLWIYTIAEFCTGFFGSFGLVLMSSFAYLADVVKNKETLTIRMVIYSLVSSLSSIIGSSMAASLMEVLSLSYILIVGQVLSLLSFTYAMIRLKQIPPSMIRKLKVNECEADVNEPDDLFNDKDPLISSLRDDRYCCLPAMFRNGYLLVISVWRTYIKFRPNHVRTYLLSLTVVYGIYVIGEMGRGSITSLYLFHSPFSWTGEQLGYYKTAASAVTFTGNLIGALILKKFLKCRETTIILVALFSSIAHFVVFGISSTTWMLYLAMSVGCLGPLFLPAVKSFTSQLVEEDEVGKSFVAYAFTADLAIIIDVVAANSIYSATVFFYPGLIFLICAGLLSICFIVVLCIHIDLLQWNKLQSGMKDDPVISPALA